MAHPEKVYENARRTKLKNKYGITFDDERAMRLAQRGLCAFERCDAPATDIDHIVLPDGRPWVRGILCHDHNVALGYLRDKAESAEDAITYLRQDARRRMAAS